MQHIIKLVIMGRDGILNDFRDDHVKAPEEWYPIPGALEAVARMNHAGWHAVVATNQSGIGRGMIDMASVNAVHAHMLKCLMAVGGRIARRGEAGGVCFRPEQTGGRNPHRRNRQGLPDGVV